LKEIIFQTQEETTESKQEDGELRESGEDTKLTEYQILEQIYRNVSIKNFELQDMFSVLKMKIGVL
jgi:hypothetical protein